MDKFRILYYASTIFFTFILAMSAGHHLFSTEEVAQEFVRLGYPSYLVWPLGAVKFLGLVAIWSRKSKMLLGLAYAGFFYDLLLACFAQLMIGSGDIFLPLAALLLVIVSYFSQRRVFAKA